MNCLASHTNQTKLIRATFLLSAKSSMSSPETWFTSNTTLKQSMPHKVWVFPHGTMTKIQKT